MQKEQINWTIYEDMAKKKGYCSICGVDEAGRGPLAGNVYAAAVILPENCKIEGINDSKKLSEKKREQLFDIICEEALSYSIGIASVQEIDNINILQATFLAMKRAIDGLKTTPDYVLVDGNTMPHIDIQGEAIIKGDAKSISIAAASILAKVSRDRYMKQMDKLYPEYQFAKHKGYGTALHIQLIKEYGPCEIHRKSFLKKILGE